MVLSALYPLLNLILTKPLQGRVWYCIDDKSRLPRGSVSCSRSQLLSSDYKDKYMLTYLKHRLMAQI